VFVVVKFIIIRVRTVIENLTLVICRPGKVIEINKIPKVLENSWNMFLFIRVIYAVFISGETFTDFFGGQFLPH